MVKKVWVTKNNTGHIYYWQREPHIIEDSDGIRTFEGNDWPYSANDYRDNKILVRLLAGFNLRRGQCKQVRLVEIK